VPWTNAAFRVTFFRWKLDVPTFTFFFAFGTGFAVAAALGQARRESGDSAPPQANRGAQATRQGLWISNHQVT
jgi:hypothetical protein